MLSALALTGLSGFCSSALLPALNGLSSFCSRSLLPALTLTGLSSSCSRSLPAGQVCLLRGSALRFLLCRTGNLL